MSFEALAHPHRRKILEEIIKKGEVTPGDLLEKISISGPTMTTHLNTLFIGKLISKRRDQNHIFYRVNKKGMKDLHEYYMSLIGSHFRDGINFQVIPNENN